MSPIQIAPDVPASSILSLSAYRIYHECYRCGHFEMDLKVLDRHEDQCNRTRSKTKPK